MSNQTCSCGKGYKSLHDGKCGNCRSKKERLTLDLKFKKQAKLDKVLEELQARINQ